MKLEPVAAGAALGDDVTVHVCTVSGRIGGQKARCLGTVAETHRPPAWDELDALRSIAAVFDSENAFLALARRPRGALGHDAEEVSAWLLSEGEVVDVTEARLSTVYDGNGRQRSAGLELWVPEQDFPLRGSGHGGGRDVAGAGGARRARGGVPLADGRPRGRGRVRAVAAPRARAGVITTVISDFGGVLTTPLGNAFAAWSKESGVPLEDLGTAMAKATEDHGGQHPLFMLERGELTETEFLQRLQARDARRA